MADSWPPLLTGAAVIEQTGGMNLPIAGFAAAAVADLCPILWCAAEPSAPVTDVAFDTITGWIEQGLRDAGPLDAVFLDLHGAMITDSHPDGEGAVLARVRDCVGPDVPIAISLDMHANVTARMVALADVVCIYRTYPHLDMAETGARAWHRLAARLAGQPSVRAFRQAPFLIPLHAQQTGADPARALYAALPDDADGHVEMALGFTAGDMPDCGPSVIAHARDTARAEALADAALDRLLRAEHAFAAPLTAPGAAVDIAMRAAGEGPVVLADVQDNPGAGGSSDTTGLLRALVAAGARGVLMGLFHDPALVQLAVQAGAGSEITGALGGRSGLAEDVPFAGRFRVQTLSDGQVRYSGAMYGGGVATLGPSCVLQVLGTGLGTGAEIQIVVTSLRNQCLDLAQFTHFGLDPTAAAIIAVKSTAHFRADFEPIASRVIPVAAPGLFPCDLSRVPYRALRPGVRRAPG